MQDKTIDSQKDSTQSADVSKRDFLKLGGSLVAGAVAAGMSSHGLAHKPAKKPLPKADRNPHGLIVGHGDFKYKVNYLWGNLDPSKVPVENCHGLDIDSKGRIVMVTDSDKNNFVIYNKDGKLLDAWGTQYPGAHSLKISRENGEDFIYIVDGGWVLDRNRPDNQWKNKWYRQSGFISKLTIDGKLVFTLPHPVSFGIYEPGMMYQPTDIAIGPNGDLYITDGYGSNYILHYDANGRYIRHWGAGNNKDKNYNFHNPHGIGVDHRNPKDPHLVISSRSDNVLKMFSLDGKYRSTLALPGAFAGGPTFDGENIYSPVCWSKIDGKMAPNSGFITILDKNNRVVSNPGGTEPHYDKGTLAPMQSTWDVFNHCHAVCVDDDKNLYVGQWNANQAYPIKLERI